MSFFAFFFQAMYVLAAEYLTFTVLLLSVEGFQNSVCKEIQSTLLFNEGGRSS